MIGIGNKSRYEPFEISVFGVGIDGAVGYDVVNSRRFQFYPQLTISYQRFEIDIERKDVPALADGIGALITNPMYTGMNKSSMLLTYGAEANYHLNYSSGGKGIILAVKYGLTADLIQGTWKIDGEKIPYDSSDRIKESRLMVMLRFYFK
jgi:hypothetical protein